MAILRKFLTDARLQSGRKTFIDKTAGRFRMGSSGIAVSMTLLLVLLVVSAQAQPSEVGEYELKAAYLFNFAKFIQWPNRALNEDTPSIVIGILGEDPFGRVIEDIVNSETAQGKPIQIRRYKDLPPENTCHILFISESEKARLSEILKMLSGQSTLTVGETENFARQGGMVNFIFEGKKIRFQINKEEAERHDIKIKSQLLKLAQIVQTKDDIGS